MCDVAYVHCDHAMHAVVLINEIRIFTSVLYLVSIVGLLGFQACLRRTLFSV